VVLVPPPTPCCDLSADRKHPYRGTPAHTVVHPVGGTFRLCEQHYAAYVLVATRARYVAPRGRGGYAHRRDARG